MAEIFNIVSIVSYILAIVFLIISVFLWIKFKILGVIGDLSGRTAKKSITKMREMNEKNGAKFYKANPNFGKETGSIIKEVEKIKESNSETGLLYENRENNVSISAQTGLLAGETVEIVDTEETTELEKIRVEKKDRQNDVIEKTGFELIEEILLIHTDEVPV